jgi:sugar/nucleoside kinase (ribokinase family)
MQKRHTDTSTDRSSGKIKTGSVVLGMGAVAMDLVLSCEDIPREDGFSLVHEERWMPGGSCSNVLVTLTSMDIPCAICAQIGDDPYGDGVRADLDRNGISTKYLMTSKGAASLHTMVIVGKDGARSILVNRGDAFFSLADSLVSLDMLNGIKVYYTDMFTARPALKLGRLCRDSGIPIVFNLECSMAFMESCGVGRNEVEEMMSLCDLLIVGKDGLHDLIADADEMKAAVRINELFGLSQGVVATLGEKGAFWAGSEQILVPSFNVEAVDTTGAGDAFAGGLIYGRFMKGWTMNDALRFANGCGAFKCRQPGPRFTGNQDDVETFMEAHKNESN